MRRPWFGLTVAAALGGVTVALSVGSGPALGQGRTPALIRGGGSAGVEKEPSYRFTTEGGNTASAQFDRNVLKVPADYGKLLSITMANQRPVLWYEDAEGSVRNVVLSDAESLVRIEREASRPR